MFVVNYFSRFSITINKALDRVIATKCQSKFLDFLTALWFIQTLLKVKFQRMEFISSLFPFLRYKEISNLCSWCMYYPCMFHNSLSNSFKNWSRDLAASYQSAVHIFLIYDGLVMEGILGFCLFEALLNFFFAKIRMEFDAIWIVSLTNVLSSNSSFEMVDLSR